jgi:hypothetical protein
MCARFALPADASLSASLASSQPLLSPSSQPPPPPPPPRPAAACKPSTVTASVTRVLWRLRGGVRTPVRARSSLRARRALTAWTLESETAGACSGACVAVSQQATAAMVGQRRGAPSRASSSVSASSARMRAGAGTMCQRSACSRARARVRMPPSVSSRRPFTCGRAPPACHRQPAVHRDCPTHEPPSGVGACFRLQPTCSGDAPARAHGGARACTRASAGWRVASRRSSAVAASLISKCPRSSPWRSVHTRSTASSALPPPAWVSQAVRPGPAPAGRRGGCHAPICLAARPRPASACGGPGRLAGATHAAARRPRGKRMTAASWVKRLSRSRTARNPGASTAS